MLFIQKKIKIIKNVLLVYLIALQLFSLTAHHWSRDTESKENYHGRTSPGSGKSGVGTHSEQAVVSCVAGSNFKVAPRETAHTFPLKRLQSGGGEDLLGPVINFFHSMATLQVTETEYALLTATALLCSGHNA